MAVAEHEGGTVGATGRTAARRHRMAVYQDAVAETLLGALDQAAQRLVIRPVVAADALQPFLEGQFLAVDVGAIGDHPGDGAQARGDTGGGGVGIGRQAIAEYRGVELVGLAVGIDEGAREEGVEQRRAHLRCAAEDLVHEAVLGAPEAHRIEARGSQKIGGIFAAAVRRGKDQRQGLPLRLDDLVRLWGLGARRDRVHVSMGLFTIPF